MTDQKKPPKSEAEDISYAQTQAGLSLGPTLDSSTNELNIKQSTLGRVELGKVALTPLDFTSRYEEQRLLGAGGMGEVKLCKDKQIGREIALKSLRQETNKASKAVARFVQEAKIQGQLEHPAVVPVYDLSTSPTGTIYFTMKRIRGNTLEEILTKLREGDTSFHEKYSRRKLLSAFSNICLAIDFAHSRGVVHRDLKPANIMLGDFGEVNLLDWGIAKLLGQEEKPDKSLEIELSEGGTLAGTVLGTPGYMSPEQAQGDTVGIPADVYSLGVILFELIALSPLHRGNSVAQLLMSSQEDIDARPSQRNPHQEIPPELDSICVKATAKNPLERFASARLLSEEIERFLDGDRDLERRRQLAHSYTEEALALLETPEKSHEKRLEAIRGLTRAIALDPDSGKAASLLAKTLLETPEKIPQEAIDEMRREKLDGRRTASALSSFIRTFDTVLILVILMWMGVRDWLVVGLGMSTLGISGLLNWYWWKYQSGDIRRWAGVTSFLLSVLFVSFCSFLLGPFILVPIFCLANAVLFGIQTNFKLRLPLIAFSLLPILLPLLLQLFEVLPPNYSVSAEQIIVHAQAVEFTKIPTLALLLFGTILLITVPVHLIGRVHDSVTTMEQKLFFHSWNLRRLVPEEKESLARGKVRKLST